MTAPARIFRPKRIIEILSISERRRHSSCENYALVRIIYGWASRMRDFGLRKWQESGLEGQCLETKQSAMGQTITAIRWVSWEC